MWTKKGVLSAMRNATREPFAHGCVLGIVLAKMRCIIPYGRRPPHGSPAIMIAYHFGLSRDKTSFTAPRAQDAPAIWRDELQEEGTHG